MRWEKVGKLFDPTKHPAFADFVGFAQSPQTLLFDGFVRIYFSVRRRTSNGKFVSHVRYIDMDRSFRRILDVARHVVIPLGRLGTFDEHGIFPMNVVRLDERILAYTSGWSRRCSVSVETGIGAAESWDGGATFERRGDGPILSASLHEPFLVCDPFVRRFAQLYHMWYIHGTQWARSGSADEPERTYVIGHAVSDDSFEWRKEGRAIIRQTSPEECQALPTVIEIDGRYHMYFCYRQSQDFRRNRDRGYRLGYAVSSNLVDWVRDDAHAGIDLTAGSWDSDMMCYPHLVACDGQVYMLYNGNEFGREGFGLARLRDAT